jgi:hypothetical protein
MDRRVADALSPKGSFRSIELEMDLLVDWLSPSDCLGRVLGSRNRAASFATQCDEWDIEKKGNEEGIWKEIECNRIECR